VKTINNFWYNLEQIFSLYLVRSILLNMENLELLHMHT